MRELSGEARATGWSSELGMKQHRDVGIQKVSRTLSGAAPMEGGSGSLIAVQWEVRKERTALQEGER